jgi:hypothetical protein
VKKQMEEFDDPNEPKFGGDGEEFFYILQIGDNFAIPAIEGNAKGVNFYILQCQHKKFMVSEHFACVWGCEFDMGDYVLGRTYYQKWGQGSQSYVFLDHSNILYINVHLVKAIKFP